MAKRCRHPHGISIKPDGINELMACRPELKEVHQNVTVYVSQCPKCGFVEICWRSQENSEHTILGELGPEPDEY